MWLTERLLVEEGLKLRGGQAEGRGAQFAVQGEREFRTPEMLFPYGFSSTAASGKQAVMLDRYCAGVTAAPDAGLQEGEVRLYSAGGAEILLKRSGEVVINGRVFAPKEA